MTDDSWWLDDQDAITADDIRHAHQEALGNGADPYILNKRLEQAVQEAGGTIEALAQRWTERNRMQRALAEFREQINRGRRHKPHPSPAPAPEEPAVPEAALQEAMLRELIQRFPDIARDVLANSDDNDR